MICWHELDLQCRKNHRGDGDLGFVFGRCRSGRRWFWFACTYGVGENRTDRGWSDSEEQTLGGCAHCDHPDRRRSSRLRQRIARLGQPRAEEDQRREASRQAAIRRQGIARHRVPVRQGSLRRRLRLYLSLPHHQAHREAHLLHTQGRVYRRARRANRLRQYHFDG